MKTNLRYMCWYFIWCLILSIGMWFSISEYLDARKLHTKLHGRVDDHEYRLKKVEELKIDCSDWVGEYGSKYRVCCHEQDCWEALKKETK